MNLDSNTDSIESTLAFVLADDKDVTFECRVQEPVAGAVFRCGLEGAANANGIRFEVAAESAVLTHDTSSDSGKVDIVATKIISAAAWVKLGFRVRGSGDGAEFTGYADGVKIASAKIGDMNALAVSPEPLKLYIVTADDKDLYVDWVRVAQLR